ncbi:MAG: DUF5054 domain-containing protein [Firmicutes bacterium]|nr:DUF5054 domain-containing protein [Bacillota bacterium]
MEIQRVHVVFKTHLDVGFTDFAANVIQRFEHEYIPAAIEVARACQTASGERRFVWTLGSFLVTHALDHLDGEALRRFVSALEEGDVAWHGLPFSMHSELMDQGLFRHALSLSAALDRRFGRRTTAAKMTDVPGHTRAIVPLLAEAGINYLHIGVNPVSTRPRVPTLFRWAGPEGQEVIVHYANQYGEEFSLPGMEDVLVFIHAGDNQGPPTVDAVQALYKALEQRFPGARIFGSTLTAFAEALWPFRHRLPLVTQEIGDTWIHGVASDPDKVAGFRALCRLRETWLRTQAVTEEELVPFSHALLMVPEHTWGVDHKKFLADYRHYEKVSFVDACGQDAVNDDAIPPKYAYLSAYVSPDSERRRYSELEASWDEQRHYLAEALEALPRATLKEEARRALKELKPRKTEAYGLKPVQPGELLAVGAFRVRFRSDGAIESLQDGGGREWVSAKAPIGLFSYETFDADDYRVWTGEYLRDYPRHYAWADADFGKPGLELAKPVAKHRLWLPQSVEIWRDRGALGDDVIVVPRMSPDASQSYGCPRRVEMRYRFWRDAPRVSVVVQWFDKDAVRWPEAIWWSLGIGVDSPARWRLDKLGLAIDPGDVVLGGNRGLHAVGRGITYEAADARVEIASLDAPVVSLGRRNLLTLVTTAPDLDQGFHFNLHNNVWGTNFRVWYRDDAKFRFDVHLENVSSELA